MSRVTLLLVCSLLTLDITLASYGANLLNFIIRPAGRSRSFKWLGRGDPNAAPLRIPRPPFIPRWLPRERPEYVAKWVPTTPAPPSAPQVAAAIPNYGFGAPKPNSVVTGQNAPVAYVAPPSAPATYSAPVAPAAPQVPAPASDYAAPRPEDIVTGGASVIPETAIRNSLQNNVQLVVADTPAVSALVQHNADGFGDVDPGSIIFITDDLENSGEVNILEPTPSNVFSPTEPIFIDNGSFEELPSPAALATNEDDDLVFIVAPEDSLQVLDNTASKSLLTEASNNPSINVVPNEEAPVALFVDNFDALQTSPQTSHQTSHQTSPQTSPQELPQSQPEIFVTIDEDLNKQLEAGDFRPSQEVSANAGSVSSQAFVPSVTFDGTDSPVDQSDASIFVVGEPLPLLTFESSKASPVADSFVAGSEQAPPVLSPPRTPLLASNRRNTVTPEAKPLQPLQPSSRALEAPSVIPVPAIVPLLSPSSVTLALPDGSHRQARVDNSFIPSFFPNTRGLPFGARLRPRPHARSFLFA